MTRSGKGKVAVYKQLLQDNYDEAGLDGNEFVSGRSDQKSDTGLCQDQDDVRQPEGDPFI